MPPSLALLAAVLLVVVVLRWSKHAADSPALWLPVMWLFLVGSRLPSVWLGGGTAISAVAASEEGSALDRTVYLALLGTALWVLARRRIDWPEFFARNSILVLFVAFTLLSVTWSDYLYVSFKRWVRDLSPYAMALVVLSEPRPLVAVSSVMRRVFYILLILSLVLIRYTDMGIVYDFWDGRPMYVGISTGKNSLSLICLIAILFFFWDTLGRWPERKSRTEKLVLVANVTSIAIALYLLRLADSATSRACLIVGCIIILVVRSKWARAKSRLLTMTLPAAVIGYIVLESLFGLSDTVAALLGRDPTLTGRTDTWQVLLQRQTNPLIGLGYGSLWIGDRMASIMSAVNASYLNETHNGYLDLYLTLGLVGLGLCGVFLLSSYRRICKQIVVSPHHAAFALSFWVVAVLYNVTETAVSGTLVWSVLLFFTIVVPSTENAEGLPSNRRILPRRTVIDGRRARRS